jgi:hypothetical protein
VTPPSDSQQRGGAKEIVVVLAVFGMIGPLLAAFVGMLLTYFLSGLPGFATNLKGFIFIYAAVMFLIPGIFLGAVILGIRAVTGKIGLLQTMVWSAVLHAFWVAHYTSGTAGSQELIQSAADCLPGAMVATAVCWFLTKDILAPSHGTT